VTTIIRGHPDDFRAPDGGLTVQQVVDAVDWPPLDS
jgi:hypothetical protein